MTSTYHLTTWMFQSTPLLRGATTVTLTLQRLFLFQSTPLLRGATNLQGGILLQFEVSIHAPLARGDAKIIHLSHLLSVSIHAPLARGDDVSCTTLRTSPCFNPRPSCEGRRHSRCSDTDSWCFNPRPSCEGRRCKLVSLIQYVLFQSTPLLRGATE